MLVDIQQTQFGAVESKNVMHNDATQFQLQLHKENVDRTVMLNNERIPLKKKNTKNPSHHGTDTGWATIVKKGRSRRRNKKNKAFLSRNGQGNTNLEDVSSMKTANSGGLLLQGGGSCVLKSSELGYPKKDATRMIEKKVEPAPRITKNDPFSEKFYKQDLDRDKNITNQLIHFTNEKFKRLNINGHREALKDLVSKQERKKIEEINRNLGALSRKPIHQTGSLIISVADEKKVLLQMLKPKCSFNPKCNKSKDIIKIHLIKAEDVASRHRDKKKNLPSLLKMACQNALQPHLLKIGLKLEPKGVVLQKGEPGETFFHVNDEGSVFLNVRHPDAAGGLSIKEIEVAMRRAMNHSGMERWVRGESGWEFSPLFSSRNDQKATLAALNKLQDVFKVCTTLYSMDKLRFLYNKTEILRKSSNIIEFDHDLRNLCEIIIAFDENPDMKPSNAKPGLLETSSSFEGKNTAGAKVMTVEHRWHQIMEAVWGLMRTAGPSAPIQWAAHPPLNRYSLTVVTKETQQEVVEAVICVIRNLFWGKSPEGVGVGDVWYLNDKRRKTDWQEDSGCSEIGNHLKGFESAEALRKILNVED